MFVEKGVGLPIYQYCIRRLIAAVPKVFIVSIIIFAVLRLAPGSPVDRLVPAFAPPEVVQATTKRLGLDKPLWIQYGIWVGNIFKGDWGKSIISNRPVIALVYKRALVTLALSIPSTILVYLLAIPIGILSAVRRYSLFDHASMIFVIFGAAMPSFWLQIMSVYLFSLKLHWFPTSGVGGIRYLFLPVATLTIVGMALVARITRSSMLDVIRQDYITSAIADGLPKPVVYYLHALKNALLPVVTLFGLRFGWLIAYGVLTEFVFDRPGLGRELVEAIYTRDFPVVQVILVILILFVILGNLLADILYAVIDPRIRY